MTDSRLNANHTTSNIDGLTGRSSFVHRIRPRTCGQSHGRSVDRPFSLIKKTFFHPHSYTHLSIHACPVLSITALSPSLDGPSSAIWPSVHPTGQVYGRFTTPPPSFRAWRSGVSGHTSLRDRQRCVADTSCAHECQRTVRCYLFWQIVPPYPRSLIKYFSKPRAFRRAPLPAAVAPSAIV